MRDAASRGSVPVVGRPSDPLAKQADEGVSRDDGREEVIDALHCRRLLLWLLAAASIANDDRHVTIIARGARIAFNAPIEMYTGQDQDLNALAG